MESSEDKHWAQKALIDPLNEPEPSALDGPGTHFRPDSRSPSLANSVSPSVKLQKKNPYRSSTSASKNPFVSETEAVPPYKKAASSYPSPPQSVSPRRDQFPHRQEAFADFSETSPMKNGSSGPSRRRGSSLTERFPGDKSHKPLDTLRADNKVAHRSPHMRKHHQIRPDIIDSLDTVANYHHEGPFDAAYVERNSSFVNAPIQALAHSNEETLKATPKEMIMDSLEKHRPLDGVAAYQPGEVDRNGNLYEYEPGENMMIECNPEGGPYKRWPGVEYHPDDIKGKGEPSYSIEKALKEHKQSSHRRFLSADVEMTSRPRASSHGEPRGGWDNEENTQSDLGRSNTTGRKMNGGSIRRTFGSLRRSLSGRHDD